MSTVETPQAGGTPPESPERSCPRCGAGLAPEQDWCLACGTAVTTRVERPPNWKLPIAVVGTVLALAFAALLVAFLEVSDDDGEQLARAPVATPAATATPEPSPFGAATPEAGTGVEPGVTPDADADEGFGGEATPAPTLETPGGVTEDGSPGNGTLGDGATGGAGSDDGTADDGATDDGTAADDGTTTDDGATGDTPTSDQYPDWPAGQTAWTVVLFSGETKSEAESRARELAQDGTTVGILDSDDYESLRRGYYVVFSGQYTSQDEAEAAAEAFTGNAQGAYPRRVVPR